MEEIYTFRCEMTKEFNNIFYDKKTLLNINWNYYSHSLIRIILDEIFIFNKQNINIYNDKEHNMLNYLNLINDTKPISPDDITEITTEIIKMINYYYANYVKISILKYTNNLTLIVKNKYNTN